MATEWTSAKLEEVAKTATGGTPARSNHAYFNGSIPWVKSGELDDNIIYDTEEHLSSDALRDSSAKIFPKGTVLVALYGATVGKTAILETEAATNQAICAIFVDHRVLDHQYLRYFLMHIRRDLLGQRYGGAQPNISQTIIRNTRVDYPPIREQRKITLVLSAVQQAIARQERLIALIGELKKALMHKLFTEGTLGEPPKQTEIGPVPESWQLVEFERLAVLQRGVDLTRNEFREGTVPVAGSNGIIGYHDRANVSGPGVTVGRSGSVGKVAYYEGEFWAHNTSLYVKSFCGNDPRYTAFHLETLNLGRFRAGASVPTLDRNSFKTLPIALPPLEEQKAIAGALAAVDIKASAETRRKLALYALFRTLLHQLITAQIRVDDLDLSALEEAEEESVGAV